MFTDSGYHSVFTSTKLTKEMVDRLAQIGIHFKAYRNDHMEVGEVFKQQYGSIPEVSAGTTEHVLTTCVSTPAIKDFLN